MDSTGLRLLPKVTDQVNCSNNKKKQMLREMFNYSIKSKSIRCLSQLKYILQLKNNMWYLDEVHTLHLGKDGRSLLYTDVVSECRILVCWKGCNNEEGLGENNFLLCGPHADEYLHLIYNECYGHELDKTTILYASPPQKLHHAKQNIEMLAAAHYVGAQQRWRIIDAILYLSWMTSNDPTSINPLRGLPDNIRSDFIKLLNGNIVFIDGYYFSYDGQTDNFLMKDSLSSECAWSSVCNSSGCYNLVAIPESRKCPFDDESPTWKCFAWKEITKLLNINSKTEMTFRHCVELSDIIRERCDQKPRSTHERGLVLVPGILRLIPARSRQLDQMRVGYMRKSYRICVGCGDIFVRLKGKCTCLYEKVASVFVVEVPPGSRNFYVNYKVHDDPRIYHDWKLSIITIAEKSVRKFKVIFHRICYGGIAEAMRWSSGLILYMLLESVVFSIPIKILNAKPIIVSGSWNVVNSIGSNRGIRISSVNENVTVFDPVEFEFCNVVPSSQDWSPNVYIFQFEELVYIGLNTTLSPLRRKSFSSTHVILKKNNQKDETTCDKIFERMKLRGLSFTAIEPKCLAKTTSVKYDAAVMETLFILAYSIHADLVKPYTTSVLNQRLSTSNLPVTWFQDFQFVVKSLFNANINILKSKCTFDKSLLFR